MSINQETEEILPPLINRIDELGIDNWEQTREDIVDNQIIIAMWRENNARKMKTTLSEEEKLGNRSRCLSCQGIVFTQFEGHHVCAICGKINDIRE